MIAPSTAGRVARHTPDHVNEAIARQTEANLAFYRRHPRLIPRRLRELEAEWDIERTLESWSSGLTIAGLSMAVLTGRRRWFLLPLAVQSFFLQHAMQGWCPPLPVLRRLGFRTQMEIDEERHALEAIRNGEPADADSGGETHARHTSRGRAGSASSNSTRKRGGGSRGRASGE